LKCFLCFRSDFDVLVVERIVRQNYGLYESSRSMAEQILTPSLTMAFTNTRKSGATRLVATAAVIIAGLTDFWVMA
jgi:hypothetical protein